MKYITDKNGNKYIQLTKKEFDENFIVGCLHTYESNGTPNSVVKIQIYGDVPNLEYCVLKKTTIIKKLQTN